MSCPPLVQFAGVSIPPSTDANAIALQAQVSALQHDLCKEIECLKGTMASHANYSAMHYAPKCAQETMFAVQEQHKANLSKTLAFASQNHSALAARTEKLAQDSTKSDRAIWAWVAQAETYLQAWQQFEFFRMTQVTAINADASCRFESDYLTAQQKIDAINVSAPATINNAVSAVLNALASYVRGADLKALRNREFITSFAWGTYAGVGGAVDYGFGAAGYALVGAFGLN